MRYTEILNQKWGIQKARWNEEGRQFRNKGRGGREIQATEGWRDGDENFQEDSSGPKGKQSRQELAKRPGLPIIMAKVD